MTPVRHHQQQQGSYLIAVLIINPLAALGKAPRLGHRCCTGGAPHGKGFSLSIISVGIGCGGWRWHWTVQHQGETFHGLLLQEEGEQKKGEKRRQSFGEPLNVPGEKRKRKGNGGGHLLLLHPGSPTPSHSSSIHHSFTADCPILLAFPTKCFLCWLPEQPWLVPVCTSCLKPGLKTIITITFWFPA